MITRAFRVAQKSLVFDTEFKDVAIPKEKNVNKILDTIFDLIKSKKIDSSEKLFLFLEFAEIDKKDFEKAIFKKFENIKNSPKDVIDAAYFLGEDKGIGLLKDSWLKRNIEDLDLRRFINQENWYLFRDKNWIDKNKISI
jgi:hypothetical protein